MDAMEYWRKYGKGEHLLNMLARAGTTYTYWKHICHYRKRPGTDLAHRLVAESAGELSLARLLFPSAMLRASPAPEVYA